MSDYKKQTWVDEETLVDAEHLNHIEDGIADAQNTTDEALETANEAKETAESVKDSVPTKTSELDNDSGFITDSALDGYALEDQIPTKVSELDNDVPYATKDAVDQAQTTADEALAEAEEVKESAITGINVNGTAATITDHVADIEVSGTEPTVEDETLIF